MNFSKPAAATPLSRIHSRHLLCVGVLAAISLSFAPAVHAQSPVQTPIVNPDRGVTKMDKTFATEAAHGYLRDIALSLIVQHRGSTAKVQKFAAQVYQHRESARDRLRKLTKETGLRMPVAADAHMQQQVEELRSLSGRKLDKRFLELIAATDYARFFVFELRNGALPVDKRVKRFADEQLPILRKDMERARELLRDYRHG